jgi:hypothetical protein
MTIAAGLNSADSASADINQSGILIKINMANHIYVRRFNSHR